MRHFESQHCGSDQNLLRGYLPSICIYIYNGRHVYNRQGHRIGDDDTKKGDQCLKIMQFDAYQMSRPHIEMHAICFSCRIDFEGERICDARVDCGKCPKTTTTMIRIGHRR